MKPDTALTESNRPFETTFVLDVLRLRYWQHLMNEALKKKAFTVPIHLGFGHEAIASAVSHMMLSEDQLVLSHRNITYNLARAGALKPLVQEYKLRPNAIGGGKLGSMNLSNPDWGVVYSSSILGNNLPVACGMALANQTLKRQSVVTVITGDGAMEEGAFYEALVFAKTHQLKVLFMVENNDMSMSSTIAERRCPIFLDQMCAAVNMPFFSLKGNDVFTYAALLESVRKTVDADAEPACVEVCVAALNQHAGPTPGWPTDPKRISLENGLIVAETPDDPVFVLKQRLGLQAFDAFSRQVLAEDGDV